MSSIDYKQKYLKYKNKYLELKALQEFEPQTGGFVYAPGKYLFFIPENKSKFDTQTPNELGPDYKSILVNTNGTIVGSLDNLTNYLGNCTKFLRVGKTSTGYDFANTYNTLYSNQSSSDVIKAGLSFSVFSLFSESFNIDVCLSGIANAEIPIIIAIIASPAYNLPGCKSGFGLPFTLASILVTTTNANIATKVKRNANID